MLRYAAASRRTWRRRSSPTSTLSLRRREAMAFPPGERPRRAPFYARPRCKPGAKLGEPDMSKYFEALLRLGDYISQVPERRPLAEAALDAALLPLGLDRGGLFLVQEQGGDLLLEASRGMPPPFIKRPRRQAIAAVGPGVAGARAPPARALA